MPELVATPFPDDGDPIDSRDRETLRREILRLRDRQIGSAAQEEILHDLVVEREQQIAELDATIQQLAAELGRNPLMRVARAVARRVRR